MSFLQTTKQVQMISVLAVLCLSTTEQHKVQSNMFGVATRHPLTKTAAIRAPYVTKDFQLMLANNSISNERTPLSIMLWTQQPLMRDILPLGAHIPYQR